MKESAESQKPIQCLLWEDLFDRSVAVKFRAQPQTCSAGLLLMGALDRQSTFPSAPQTKPITRA
jgi:hypothetical protein